MSTSNWADAMHTLFGLPAPPDWRESPTEAKAYCSHCCADFTARLLASGIALCPKCDMPGIIKVGVAALNLRQHRSEIVSKLASNAKCLVLHGTRVGTVCQKEQGHAGFHTDDRPLAQNGKGYSWPKRDTDRQACWERHPQRAGNVPGAHCVLVRGHRIETGHFSGSEFTRWGATTTGKSTEKRKHMITVTLSDIADTVVGLEFHHEFEGDGKESPKVLVGTKAKLFRLDEIKDADKPEVTTLVKTLLNAAEVKCHPNDRKLGKAGGRRAALKRLLCPHWFGSGKAPQRCLKCGVKYEGCSTTKFVQADRKRIWNALWEATASVRTYQCGCMYTTTISGKSRFAPCEEHTKPEAV